jgi:amino acid transporter
MSEKRTLQRELGTWHVAVAGVAMVVASTTLISDFVGWLTLGFGFAFALLIAFAATLLLGLSIAELSTRFPRAGAIYTFAREGLPGRGGARIGLFLALLFYGTMVVAAAGELNGGAHGLRMLLGQSVDLRLCIALLLVAALLPNLVGLQSVAWVNAILLIGMLGIRWWVGIAALLGWTEPGTWDVSNIPMELAPRDLLTRGLGLAVWTFIGIEFVAPLAEEVKQPRLAMPRGVVITLLVVLGTSVLTGVGAAGVLSSDEWSAIAFGAAGCKGDCVQLAVGQTLFGAPGKTLMAIASVTATYGSASVGLAATSRILYSVARDRRRAPLSSAFASLNRFSVPWFALLVTTILLVIPALWSAQVVDWIYTAAYVWLLLFAVYHVLLIAIRRRQPAAPEVFQVPAWLPWVGLALVFLSLYYSFIELGHARYGGRAVLLVAVVAAASLLFRRSRDDAG